MHFEHIFFAFCVLYFAFCVFLAARCATRFVFRVARFVCCVLWFVFCVLRFACWCLVVSALRCVFRDMNCPGLGPVFRENTRW